MYRVNRDDIAVACTRAAFDIVIIPIELIVIAHLEKTEQCDKSLRR